MGIDRPKDEHALTKYKQNNNNNNNNNNNKTGKGESTLDLTQAA